MKDYGDYPVFKMVIEMGWIALETMTRKIGVAANDILGYNTDAVKLRAGAKFNRACVREIGEVCKMGEYHVEDTTEKSLSGRHPDEVAAEQPPVYEYKPVEIHQTTDTPIGQESCIVQGMAGAGKSYEIKQLYNKETDLILCKTHLACENLKKEGVLAKTIDSYMFDGKSERLNISKLANVKRLICDEYTMIPPTEMDAILRAKQLYGFTLLLFGDKDQCRSLDNMWVNYITNKRVLEAFQGRIVVLSYKHKRYDNDLYQRLKHLQTTGRMNLPDNNLVPSFFNLCLNDTVRHPVNKRCFERWVKETNAEVVAVNGMKVALGLLVMCYDNNDTERGICKTNRFTIRSITKDDITLVRDDMTITLSHKDFTHLFDYAFCVTIYKFQGGQINDQAAQCVLQCEGSDGAAATGAGEDEEGQVPHYTRGG